MATQFFQTHQLPEKYLQTCPVLDQWTQIFTHTTLFQNSFFPSAISLWNTLPEYVYKIHSLSSFKLL